MKPLFITFIFFLLMFFYGYSQTNYLPNVTVSTLAGFGSDRDTSSNADGPGVIAGFNSPMGVAVDRSGNVYVADMGNNEIRKISPDGFVRTFAGSSTAGCLDGQGSAASFNGPWGIAVDDSGNVYVADTYNNEIRKITPGGLVSTIAGSAGVLGQGSLNGKASASTFFTPEGVTVDDSGNVYVADTFNNEIRKITPGGLVSTFAGSTTEGYSDGQGTAASFWMPSSVTIDDSSNIFVGDGFNQIRKISMDGFVTTFAGSTQYGSSDGQRTIARFDSPLAVATDASGNIYVADAQNHNIRKISSNGLVYTVAGSALSFGNTDGEGSTALFNEPYGIAVDISGNLYVADAGNNRIRKITIGSDNTGTINVSKPSCISVYPNPAKDILNIDLSEAVNGTLSISDIQGRLVLTQPVNSKQVQLSIASLQNGVYVLSIVSVNASYVTRVVIAK